MQRDLYKLIAENFDLEELREMTFELDVPFEDLRGSGLRAKARELQMYMTRRGRINELMTVIAEARDFLDLTPYGHTGGGSSAGSPSATAMTPTTSQPDATTTTSTPVADEQLYEDFELRVGMKVADGRYPVEVTRSPQGEMASPVWQEFPLDDYDFIDLVDYLRDLVGRSNDAVELGKKMRELLFPGQAWDLFFASRASTKQQGKGLRLRLRIDPPELSNLPWEYCYHDTFRFFALQRETPVVRYIAQPFGAETLAAPNPMKVLLAIAAPEDQAALSVDEEEKRVSSILSFLGDRVELTVLRNATPDRVHGALAARPHIFHFIGHGVKQDDGKGALAFEDVFKKTQLVDADQLMILLGDVGVKVVILNACKTAAADARDAMMGVAPALVQAEIPAVIAMQFNVPDKTALGFTRDLYRFLAAGYPLDAAVTEMRIGAYISSGDKYFWGIPALFMRAPDGVIWQKDEQVLEMFAAAQAAATEMAGPDLSQLLQELLQQFEAIRGELDPGDAEDVAEDLNDVLGLVNSDDPNLRRIGRKMDDIADILGEASSQSANELAPKVKQVLELAEQNLR
jgi:hypothetical protein